MAILGWKTARQRLREATRESLTIRAFGSHIDCTPWVIGGLWPQELSTGTAETASLANYLHDDLQRIIRTANDELTLISRARPLGLARHTAEARVIDAARARAARRIESTVRHVKATTTARTDIGATQVIPLITDTGPARGAPNPTASQSGAPAGGDPHDQATVDPAATESLASDGAEPEASTGRHRAPDNDTSAEPCGGHRALHRSPDHTGVPARADHRGPARAQGAHPDHRGPGHR